MEGGSSPDEAVESFFCGWKWAGKPAFPMPAASNTDGAGEGTERGGRIGNEVTGWFDTEEACRFQGFRSMRRCGLRAVHRLQT